MAQRILAPWGELVPGIDHELVANDLLLLPDDGRMYELVEGRLVRMPPSSGADSYDALSLGASLLFHVRARNLGIVTGADGEYQLSGPGEPVTALAPDVGYVRAGRYPAKDSPEYQRIWNVAPDLAVEFASPNQYRPEMAEKARLYLQAGVRLVWVVWRRYRQVDVWRPGADEPAQTLGETDTLDGEDVVPGFTYPVANLF